MFPLILGVFLGIFMLLLQGRIHSLVGRGGALVESMPLDQRVVGSNPALAAM